MKSFYQPDLGEIPFSPCMPMTMFSFFMGISFSRGNETHGRDFGRNDGAGFVFFKKGVKTLTSNKGVCALFSIGRVNL